MDTPVSSPSTQTNTRPIRGTFHHLQVVIGIAFILATLFTAWTPGTVLLGNPGEPLAVGPAMRPSPTPPGGPTATPRLRPLVGIVVGHWDDNTKDPGAVCTDTRLTELEVNQNIATLVKEYLVVEGYDVDLLREFDPVLDGYQASALVSIHADSCDFINDQATGFKVASALASKYPERAARLTACLRSRYAQATPLSLHSTSVTRDMTSYHAFDEIDENTAAAIIEVGFLNLDRDFLTQNPDKAARGVADGILCFLNNESVSSPPKPAP